LTSCYTGANIAKTPDKNIKLLHCSINKCTIELHHLKENIMFTFETLVDAYAKNAKAAIAYVQPDAVKTALLDLTDKQVEFSRGLAKHVETAAEYFNNNMKEATKTLFPNK
jgi:hypothetical protein